MASGGFVVDRTLAAIPIGRVLDVRAQLHLSGTLDKPPLIEGDRPVLAGGQSLQASTLYPAEKNAGLRYYLPEYRVSIDEAGRPAVELRYKPGEDDEVGRLTLALTWTPPAAAGVEVRAMDHVAVLTLRYRVPVENSASASAGGWEHTLPLQPLQPAGALLARSTTIFRDKTIFDTVYQALRSEDQGASIEILVRAHAGIRTWRQVIVARPTEVDQTRILKNRGALFTDMVHRESLAGVRAVPAAGTARVRIAAAPADVTTRVDATRAVFARPEVERVAVPARRATAPMRVAPGVIRRSAVADPIVMSPAVARAVTPISVAAAQPAVARPMVAQPMVARPMVARPMVAQPMVAQPIVAQPMVAQPAAATATAVIQPAFTRATLARVNTPRLSQAVAESDLQIVGRQAVPLHLALDTNRQPAIVDSELENRQVVPFHFNPGLPQNSDVFSVEGFDSGGIHLLLPLRLTAPDGSAHVVYQDNLMRDVVHVAPSEFRLERDTTPPFLPALSFLASEFGTTETGTADEDADVLFRVTAVYRLEPWLDPDVVELARAELGRQGLVARFTTGMSHDAVLSLDLDLLGNEQQRSGATVDPAVGITDSLDLDHNTFVRLWRERLSNPASGGVSGRVDYRLFDGSTAQVKVRLSLWEPSAELFDVTFVGPVSSQPGRYRVMIRNRVESPARITGLPGEVVEGGGMARPVAPGSVIGQVFQPQEMREIDYDVTGTTAEVGSFEPAVMARAEPNLAVLLKLLMLTPGYASLGFSITVKAAANMFGPPAAGAEPLTGLLVEFDDGSRITLGSTLMQADITLVGRLIDQILGTADDTQRYFYRVTNLHASGEGARTGWLEGRGTAPLEVGVAVAHLDF